MSKQWNDSSKKVLRPFIVKSERGKAASGAMFMPAETCYCVEEALKQGSIDLNTKLLIIDRDRHTLSIAYEKLVKMGFDQDSIYMYCGNLQDSGITQYENASGETYKGMIEFIYLDTCGELTLSMFRFISGLYHYKQVCKECTISFTFSNAERASKEFLWGKQTSAARLRTQLFADNIDVGSRCAVINKKLLKIIGNTHKLAIGRGYKEQGISVPMFTARYEPKQLNNLRKYDKLVPKNLGYK